VFPWPVSILTEINHPGNVFQYSRLIEGRPPDLCVLRPACYLS
jgi:hypothetical protein